MQVAVEIKERVESEVRRCFEAARKYYNEYTFDIPTIRYTVKGSTAGRAYLINNVVNFNPVLLNENVDAFIARTVPHECAHMIDYVVHPHNFIRKIGNTKRNLHGADFRFIMRQVLNAQDFSRCHSYDTSSVTKTSRFIWVSTQDSSIKMTLGPKQHKNMMSGNRKYRKRGHSNHTFTFSHKQGDPIPQSSHNHPTPLAADGALNPVIFAPIKTKPQWLKTKPRAQGGKSKIEMCRELFDMGMSRSDNIAMFIEQANCTPKGAATYYATIKKEQA